VRFVVGVQRRKNVLRPQDGARANEREHAAAPCDALVQLDVIAWWLAVFVKKILLTKGSWRVSKGPGVFCGLALSVRNEDVGPENAEGGQRDFIETLLLA